MKRFETILVRFGTGGAANRIASEATCCNLSETCETFPESGQKIVVLLESSSTSFLPVGVLSFWGGSKSTASRASAPSRGGKQPRFPERRWILAFLAPNSHSESGWSSAEHRVRTHEPKGTSGAPPSPDPPAHRYATTPSPAGSGRAERRENGFAVRDG